MTLTYRTTWRDVKVTYIFGKTGVGKTRTVMEHFGYDNIYRISDYHHPFDGYNQQSVLLLDEFNSQFRIQNILNYLDGYPLELPCRYSNKIACFERVFIISNLPLQKQYVDVQLDFPDIWKAFLRRIDGVYELTEKGFLPFDYTNFGGKRLLAQSKILLSRKRLSKKTLYL